MSEVDIVGYILLGLLVVATFIAILVQQEKLDDPENTEVVYLDQLCELSNLPEQGVFLLRTLRQSGNLQKDDIEFTSSAKAISAGVSTFKRAKIEYAVISKNDEFSFEVRRPYWNHRGKNEGKKVGSFAIYRNI